VRVTHQAAPLWHVERSSAAGTGRWRAASWMRASGIALRAIQPRLDAQQPVEQRGYVEILADVLLSDPAHRDRRPVLIVIVVPKICSPGRCLGVVAQRTVAHVGGDRLCRVEPSWTAW